MKLGKKLLSCLLAILMITSSVSACFTVFGVGEAQADAIYNAITMDYDGLKAAIDSRDAKRVPPQRVQPETGMWRWTPTIPAGTTLQRRLPSMQCLSQTIIPMPIPTLMLLTSLWQKMQVRKTMTPQKVLRRILSGRS